MTKDTAKMFEQILEVLDRLIWYAPTEGDNFEDEDRRRLQDAFYDARATLRMSSIEVES